MRPWPGVTWLQWAFKSVSQLSKIDCAASRSIVAAPIIRMIPRGAMTRSRYFDISNSLSLLGGSRIDHDIDDRSAAFHDRLIIDAATVVIGGSPRATAWQCGSSDVPGSASDAFGPTFGSARAFSFFGCIGFGDRHLKCLCGP